MISYYRFSSMICTYNFLSDWIFNKKNKQVPFIKISSLRFTDLWIKLFCFFSQISVIFWKIRRQIARHIIHTYLHTKATQTDKFLQIYWYSIHVYWCALEFFFLAAVHKWCRKFFLTFWPLHFFKRQRRDMLVLLYITFAWTFVSAFSQVFSIVCLFYVCYCLWSILKMY